MPAVTDSHCSPTADEPSPPHNDPALSSPSSWGNSTEHATPSTLLRIATLNINGLPKEPRHVKNSLIREAIASHHIDIIGLSEINIKWDRLYPSNRLKQRASRWWELMKYYVIQIIFSSRLNKVISRLANYNYKTSVYNS